MAPRIVECEQGSDEWYRARLGIPTASEFQTVMRTKGKGAEGESKTRTTYLRKLAGERYLNELAERYNNDHMDRGHQLEPEARELYAFLNDVEPQQVGFVIDDDLRAGCSPDALIGSNGVLEIKTALPHILIGYIEADVFPTEHKAQTQGGLWITQREWVDVAVYWPRMPQFIKRAHRDEKYIASMAQAVADFNEELDALVDRLRRYGGTPSLRDSLAASLAQPNVLMAG